MVSYSTGAQNAGGVG